MRRCASAGGAIAEVGQNVLHTGGDNRVHLSAFDLVIEQREPPIQVPLPELERIGVTEVIGAYVSTRFGREVIPHSTVAAPHAASAR